jgi:ABC-type Fe3+/spermidine/putrescine transport system ATPase subunit
MKAIEFSSVSKYYNGHLTVHDFSLHIDDGQRLVILGPSGCGKTTVLRLLAGFIVPDSGTIRVNGELAAKDGQILKEPEERHLGMVFQDLALWPHLTVRGNLEFGLKAQHIPKTRRQERICEVLRLVQMEDYIDSKPGQLSGGQQQRIALARALVLYPKILLMDEPLSGLDFELNLQVRKEILRLQEQVGFTLIYVTHNLEEAFEMATYVVVMKGGRINQEGLPMDVSGQFRNV